ncbi:uncharacterized protein EDB91DRAFT_338436 [Suillus paluster]|uniref:uncharacterized protein n=1 Tax=Suillus paluster TaxID=48578 RepID=UPI001B86B3EA|nr:uncharacterized protein EDB91DRAFT_338436 [Suillus paluster]KAG1740773.1 hypothetical protein EDB91DRAFT_338436 [Suillus paluster]
MISSDFAILVSSVTSPAFLIFFSFHFRVCFLGDIGGEICRVAPAGIERYILKNCRTRGSRAPSCMRLDAASWFGLGELLVRPQVCTGL